MEQYYLAKNSKLIDKTTLDKVSELSQLHEGLLDDRHNIFSTNNVFSMETYYDYLHSIRIVEQDNRDHMNTGKYRYLLDLGYMPVVMPAFYMGNQVHQIVIPALDAHDVPYLSLPASSLTKPSYSNPNSDIWVSKLDVYEMLNCKPEDVTVRRLLEAIL